MPIKNDETGKRWVEIETIVPGNQASLAGNCH
jgi:hypothetical protein